MKITSVHISLNSPNSDKQTCTYRKRVMKNIMHYNAFKEATNLYPSEKGTKPSKKNEADILTGNVGL